MTPRPAPLVATLLLGTALVALPHRALAQHPLVRLDIACADVRADEVRRVVRVELRALLVDEGAAPGLTHARVICREGLAALTVDDPLTAKSLRRVVDLGTAAPAVRARLLGLAVAELVTASWIELALTPAPALPPAEPPAPAAARAAGREVAQLRLGAPPPPAAQRAWRLRAAAAFDLSGFTSGPLLFGGGLRLGADLPWHLAVGLDVVFAHGRETVSLGHVAIDLVSAAPTLMAQVQLGRVGLRAGVGLRLGGLRLTGQPADPTTVHSGTVAGPFVGPLGTVGATLRLWRGLTLEVAGEAGWVTRPASGLVGHQREVSVDGAFLGLHLGLGFCS